MIKTLGKLALGTVGAGALLILGAGVGIVATSLAVIDDGKLGEKTRQSLKDLKEEYDALVKESEELNEEIDKLNKQIDEIDELKKKQKENN